MNRSLQQQLTDALDRRAESLDGATLSRLRRARAKAIEKADRPGWGILGHWGLAGTGLAAALLVALALAPTAWRAEPPTAFADDELLEIATLDVELEMVEELEFYEWLSTQPLAELSDGGAA